MKSQKMEELMLALAHHRFGQLPSDQLPGLASTLLELGFDSPEARRLAGEREPTWDECGQYFETALKAAILPVESEAGAALRIAVNYAEKIVRNELSPHEGARRIWWDAANHVMNDPNEEYWLRLRSFVGLASEYEDAPFERAAELQAEYDRDILQEAKELLDWVAQSSNPRPQTPDPRPQTPDPRP